MPLSTPLPTDRDVLLLLELAAFLFNSMPLDIYLTRNQDMIQKMKEAGETIAAVPIDFGYAPLCVRNMLTYVARKHKIADHPIIWPYFSTILRYLRTASKTPVNEAMKQKLLAHAPEICHSQKWHDTINKHVGSMIKSKKKIYFDEQITCANGISQAKNLGSRTLDDVLFACPLVDIENLVDVNPFCRGVLKAHRAVAGALRDDARPALIWAKTWEAKWVSKEEQEALGM
jgi:hypothetical protein